MQWVLYAVRLFIKSRVARIVASYLAVAAISAAVTHRIEKSIWSGKLSRAAARFEECKSRLDSVSSYSKELERRLSESAAYSASIESACSAAKNDLRRSLYACIQKLRKAESASGCQPCPKPASDCHPDDPICAELCRVFQACPGGSGVVPTNRD